MIAGFSEGQPDGDDKSSVFLLNPVTGSRRDDLPVILLSERFKRGRDFNRRAPGETIIGAAHRKASGVIHTIQELDRPRFLIDDGNGVVDGLIVFAS